MKIKTNFEGNRITMAEVLNSELNQYWSLLDVEQRQSILGMIKSFVKPKVQETEDVYSDEFKAELRRRRADYLAGGKVYAMEESLQRIDNILAK